MNTSVHGQNLIQLTRLVAFNAYLVRENDGFTLIDTNMGGSADAILQSVAKHNGAIRRIIITHAHNDHVASLDALRAQLPDADILMTARTARFLSGDMTLDADEPQAELRGGYMTVETRPTRTLVAGDRVGSLEVIAAPGHTPGQIALLDTRDRTLIAGDAFQITGGLAVSGMLRLLFPFPAQATWHKPSALHAARKLRDLHPTRLAVGHGRVLENPVPAMNAAIAAAAERWEEVSSPAASAI
jgi:glyoxylase-like metal-dependent hydrolase (beta-lactamase superfamily II)